MLCSKNSATIINYADSRHGLSCIDDCCNCHWLEMLYANNSPSCFLWWAVLFRLRIHFLSLFIYCQWWQCCLILSCEMVCVMKVEVGLCQWVKNGMPSFVIEPKSLELTVLGKWPTVRFNQTFLIKLSALLKHLSLITIASMLDDKLTVDWCSNSIRVATLLPQCPDDFV